MTTRLALRPDKNPVIARGGCTSHCATMQQTLMTMHGKIEKGDEK